MAPRSLWAWTAAVSERDAMAGVSVAMQWKAREARRDACARPRFTALAGKEVPMLQTQSDPIIKHVLCG
jgi:hypothetical protein